MRGFCDNQETIDPTDDHCNHTKASTRRDAPLKNLQTQKLRKTCLIALSSRDTVDKHKYDHQFFDSSDLLICYDSCQLIAYRTESDIPVPTKPSLPI